MSVLVSISRNDLNLEAGTISGLFTTLEIVIAQDVQSFPAQENMVASGDLETLQGKPIYTVQIRKDSGRLYWKQVAGKGSSSYLLELQFEVPKVFAKSL